MVTAVSRPFPMVLFLWSGKEPVLIHNFLQGLVQDSRPLKSLPTAALVHTAGSPQSSGPLSICTESSVPTAQPFSNSTHSTACP